MPELSRDKIVAVSDIRADGTTLSVLETHTGDLASISPEELTFILDCLLYNLHQRWCWQFHIAKNGHMDKFVTMCKKVIDCGAILDRNDVVYDGKVLAPCSHVWASNEQRLIDLFLSAGASIDTDRFGRTPLHLLALAFQAEDFDNGAIQSLLDAGVDMNATDKEGRTMFDIAVQPDMRTKGSKETIQRLQALGARASKAH
ncbi:hypothetical protein BGZ61DRAFT_203563 [Ilyonectria robusta]|uniref:uncharacterized protein n=1 Tax=Ilyonectria robusta TaxID=1079257 RepID=UPI001E8E67BC|nr:uncharacterized protein BGZ61DRAFT_203563 [Ilyonectria robusta]KAH8654675.1 hypothetical protein BGZ61DRAFT_203563 [Ilyonectria robusta]